MEAHREGAAAGALQRGIPLRRTEISRSAAREELGCGAQRAVRAPTLVASIGVSSPTGPSDEDAFWRRPDGPEPEPPFAQPAGPPAPPPYTGPPKSAPPPAGWRPPFVAESPAARELPPQDKAALDEAERSARTLTYGVGMVAGALALVAMCLLCSRLLF